MEPDYQGANEITFDRQIVDSEKTLQHDLAYENSIRGPCFWYWKKNNLKSMESTTDWLLTAAIELLNNLKPSFFSQSFEIIHQSLKLFVVRD